MENHENSASTWPLLDTLAPFLQQAWENSKFQKPTEIQKQAIPQVLEGKDVLAEAPTGSGKTLAYLFPVLQKIDPDKKDTQAVILASSRELVMQIHEELQTWSAGSGISSATLIGGANIKRQLDKLKKHPRVIIGTPGRVHELIKKKKLKMHEVKTLVLDEGDQLLAPEHKGTLEDIIKSTLAERQLLLFSATLPKVSELEAQRLMNDPEIVRVGTEAEKPDVDHGYLITDARKKVDTLKRLTVIEAFKGLVFVRDIGNLDVLAEKLRFKGLSVGVIHGDSKKEDRVKTLKAFREEKLALLLATDVAARGLDIPSLKYVINYDLPDETSQYVHRAGRTGRVGSPVDGSVISLVTGDDIKKIVKISKELNIDITEKQMYRGELIDARQQ
ncbi:putative ATP-dependent RNA helicase YfmL [Thalassobacillus devorans]|uniref:ATP-dependent RNA helicase YfmL n=1 Tax=Thalassobacillus devorans TaxID=279813 RepID=A0ABQ1NMI2_9BACI|nr:DEAD/DEAH box helicase [Thalassobacillus devorans]NIK27603.1 superfamily II DNA/RNA helicase [Thalassobacillus devorans]GGC79063.1 putative ATP-dependent RNA helicase YfmL [Thalassobacillus devorans]